MDYQAKNDAWALIRKEPEKEKQLAHLNSLKFSGINLQIVLEIINRRIEKLLSKDHRIGHSYFINITSFDELKEVFQHKVVPLLQEYFYGDYGKIGLVLGEGFVELQSSGDDEDVFAKFDYNAHSMGKQVYCLKNVLTWSNDEMFTAIQQLLSPVI
jgi:5-methylcytosine-specific restriction enzyme B